MVGKLFDCRVLFSLFAGCEWLTWPSMFLPLFFHFMPTLAPHLLHSSIIWFARGQRSIELKGRDGVSKGEARPRIVVVGCADAEVDWTFQYASIIIVFWPSFGLHYCCYCGHLLGLLFNRFLYYKSRLVAAATATTITPSTIILWHHYY